MDLSTRRIRGSPPSYSQTIAQQSKVQRHGTRTTVITCSTLKNESGGVCDPMIDEHFRRSLGKDYLSSSDDGDSDTVDKTNSTSLSVDDHFAKALGDNWLREEESELKKKKEEDVGRNLIPT